MHPLRKGPVQKLTSKGIRIHAVAPGLIWTPLQPSCGQPEEKLVKFDEAAPIGRAGRPAELTGAYVFLASGEASFVIGEALGATGGMLTS